MQSNCFNRSGRRLVAALLAGAALMGLLPGASAQSSFVFTNPPSPRSGAAGQPSHALPRRASIILIVADGLGYGDLSCYGQTKFQTPSLDRLAAEGVRFTNYTAGSAASAPAQAVLMLGKDAGHLRQRADADVPLAPGETTLAQFLRQSGYHTGLIGEWSLGGDNTSGAPWRKGFDEFAGYLDAAEAKNFYADYMWRYAPGSILTTNNLREDFIGKEMIYPNSGNHPGQYIPDLLTKAAVNFIQNNQPDEFNHYRPFFLLVHYPIPGDGTGTVPTDAPYSEEPWPQAQKNKAAMISRLDGYIGQVRQQLQDSGMTNNAVIFFTSNAGAQTNGVDPNFFQSMVASNSLRAPMIVCWPEHIPAGQISAHAMTAADVLPTVTDIALLKTPKGIDGTSVLPVLLGGQK